MFKSWENSVTVSETRRLTRASVCVHWPLTGNAKHQDGTILVSETVTEYSSPLLVTARSELHKQALRGVREFSGSAQLIEQTAVVVTLGIVPSVFPFPPPRTQHRGNGSPCH